MKKFNRGLGFLLGLILAVVMYCVFVADKLLCVLSPRPRIGFRKWLHNPNVSILRQEGAVDHNLQTISVLRVAFVLLFWFIYSLVW